MGPTRGGVVNTSRMLKTFDNILLKRGVVATVDTSKTFKPVVYCLKDKQQHSTPFFTQKSNVYKYIQIYLQTTNRGHFAYFTQQDIKDHKFQTTNLQITSWKWYIANGKLKDNQWVGLFHSCVCIPTNRVMGQCPDRGRRDVVLGEGDTVYWLQPSPRQS